MFPTQSVIGRRAEGIQKAEAFSYLEYRCMKGYASNPEAPRFNKLPKAGEMAGKIAENRLDSRGRRLLSEATVNVDQCTSFVLGKMKFLFGKESS
jgi:hypothetical protein